MTVDTKMEEGDSKVETVVKATETDSEKAATVPPLEAAAQRLDRLLGGGSTAENDRSLDFYTNPVKVVRRWLGTSSGAAKEATAASIKSASLNLLDPNGPSAAGLTLLSSSLNDAMESEEQNTAAAATGYLSRASVREVEAWLISLAVRLLWREGKLNEALDLVQKGITIVTNHLEEASLRITTVGAGSVSSLFPLLARLYRFRSLVSESLHTTGLRTDMAKAHNVASLRRDVDTQATLLNCMLRELLLNSQGM